MVGKLLWVGCLIAVGVVGCAATAKNSIKHVSLGMSADEVLDLVGEPTAQAEQNDYKAWLYEYREAGPPNCRGPDVGGVTCQQMCEHATVWFNNNEVRSITSIQTNSLEDCGTGSTPINWQHMPDYAKGAGN
jgi:Tfp pilus assembly major pilin PilA